MPTQLKTRDGQISDEERFSAIMQWAEDHTDEIAAKFNLIDEVCHGTSIPVPARGLTYSQLAIGFEKSDEQRIRDAVLSFAQRTGVRCALEFRSPEDRKNSRWVAWIYPSDCARSVGGWKGFPTLTQAIAALDEHAKGIEADRDTNGAAAFSDVELSQLPEVEAGL